MYEGEIVFGCQTIVVTITLLEYQGKPLGVYTAAARGFYLGHLFVRHCQAMDDTPGEALIRLTLALQRAWDKRRSVSGDAVFVQLQSCQYTRAFLDESEFSRS
ncbi:hypothetical protein A2368_04145 [Candidatus Collierbacteria bacterium RIFOXYB1_FULL_49_13]|uniref:Uncharacterized protein n=1 Tax=Candidatus Collierbacteria bacterium RIFOXYB1_FULL_49_13 TaxID=1817728 RepID=A0A1F5FHD4_9BACT|nr:MAG: hypothetical protein A2368_04145 [Candidatus Collierbacteria bacterium RIFOXYB1_FULL_49_13]